MKQRNKSAKMQNNHYEYSNILYSNTSNHGQKSSYSVNFSLQTTIGDRKTEELDSALRGRK